jgi:branched-chain amino acid transport system permease protein
VHWEVLVALMFIAVVLYFPGGMAHLLLNAYQFIKRRSGTHVPVYAVAPKIPGLRAPPLQSCGGDSGPVHLRFENVSVQRNEVSILNGLSLAVEHAGVYCLIGPNGAGKTSSFNVLTGRLARTSGDIFLDSQRVTGHRADVMARAGVGRKFQIPSVFNGLSVTDNLRIALWSNRAQARQLLESTTRQWRTDMLDFLENTFTFLADQADKPAGELSQGQRQMLELSMTLLAEPRLLLLDEPCAGLSTAETQQQIEVIVQAVSRLGSTALVIEHDMAAVQRLSNEVFVLHQGQLLANGTLKQMQESPLVQAVYAGGQK